MRQTVADPGGGGGRRRHAPPPYFLPNTLKSPLNWLKFSSPQNPVRPPFSLDPGPATVKCTQSEIGEKFHYIFNCPFFADQRRTYKELSYTPFGTQIQKHNE